MNEKASRQLLFGYLFVICIDSMQMSPKFNFLWGLQAFDWPVTKKTETMEAPQYKSFYFAVWSSSSLAHLSTQEDCLFCFVCHIEISQIGALQITLLVSFENSQ
jgi:hypothetical protein